jgi:hypothetical protein
MKKLFLLFIIVVIIIMPNACATKENKAKALIKKYVLQQLPDEKSYNPIEFGKIDTAFSVVETDSTYLAYAKKLVDAEDTRRWMGDHLWEKLEGKEYYALLDSMKQFEKQFQPKPIGWNMRHSFKANIGRGTHKKITVDFHMNWKLDSVYYMIPIDDELVF